MVLNKITKIVLDIALSGQIKMYQLLNFCIKRSKIFREILAFNIKLEETFFPETHFSNHLLRPLELIEV